MHRQLEVERERDNLRRSNNLLRSSLREVLRILAIVQTKPGCGIDTEEPETQQLAEAIDKAEQIIDLTP